MQLWKLAPTARPHCCYVCAGPAFEPAPCAGAARWQCGSCSARPHRPAQRCAPRCEHNCDLRAAAAALAVAAELTFTRQQVLLGMRVASRGQLCGGDRSMQAWVISIKAENHCCHYERCVWLLSMHLLCLVQHAFGRARKHRAPRLHKPLGSGQGLCSRMVDCVHVCLQVPSCPAVVLLLLSTGSSSSAHRPLPM